MRVCVRDESARRRTSPAATGERSLSLRLLGAVRCEHGEKRVGDITALSYGKNDRVVASYSPRAKAETQLLHSPPGESLTSESLEAFDGRRQGVERAVCEPPAKVQLQVSERGAQREKRNEIGILNAHVRQVEMLQCGLGHERAGLSSKPGAHALTAPQIDDAQRGAAANQAREGRARQMRHSWNVQLLKVGRGADQSRRSFIGQAATDALEGMQARRLAQVPAAKTMAVSARCRDANGHRVCVVPDWVIPLAKHRGDCLRRQLNIGPDGGIRAQHAKPGRSARHACTTDRGKSCQNLLDQQLVRQRLDRRKQGWSSGLHGWSGHGSFSLNSRPRV